jgi:hypothetical protein
MSAALPYSQATRDDLFVARHRFLWRAAIFCGVMPMAAGTAIFLSWLLVRWDWLMMAGILTIIVGAGVVLTGLVFLGIHALQARRLQPSGRWGVRTLAVAVLLLANFPLAGAYTWGAVWVVTRYTVTITNGGVRTADRVIVTGPGVSADLGAIAPGASRRASFHFAGDGPLELEARYGPTISRSTILGYVTTHQGGNQTMTFHDPVP